MLRRPVCLPLWTDSGINCGLSQAMVCPTRTTTDKGTARDYASFPRPLFSKRTEAPQATWLAVRRRDNR